MDGARCAVSGIHAAAAVAQQQDPSLQVVVAGRDRVVYSYRSPHPSGSWKQQFWRSCTGNWIWKRLHFTGLINTATTSACFGGVISLHVQPALCD